MLRFFSSLSSFTEYLNWAPYKHESQVRLKEKGVLGEAEGMLQHSLFLSPLVIFIYGSAERTEVRLF